MGPLLQLIVPLVIAIVENAPALIVEIRAAVNGSELTAEQKADMHARLDVASARVAAVTYSEKKPVATPVP